VPSRIIKDTIHTSEKINELSDFQFRLWIGLITYVDDYGRGDARPAVIKGLVYPLRDKITAKDIEKGLSELAAVGCICLYIADGKPYLYFPRWEDHQRIQNKRSKCPEPSDSQNITVSHGDSQENATRAGAESKSEVESEVESEDAPHTRVIEDWKAFMDEYHSKVPSLRPIREMTIERKRIVNARIREHPNINLTDVYEAIERSDFLTGRKDGKWQASFDWIFQKSNFQKIIEGNYDNGKKGKPGGPDNDDFIKHHLEIKDI